jgi:hypothetical protein
MLIGGYIVVVAGKENKYYNKVDAKKVNSTKMFTRSSISSHKDL